MTEYLLVMNHNLLMTLQLNLRKLNNLPTDTAIVVEGSEAGLLCSRKGADNIIDLAITCSRLNLLTFKVYDGEVFKSLEGGQGYLGESFFSGQRFLRENKYNKRLYQKNSVITHEVNVYGPLDELAGVLVFDVTYIKGILYQGEKVGAFDALPQTEPVKFYKGGCESRNLFSYFDADNKNKPCSMTEGVYRDESWNN